MHNLYDPNAAAEVQTRLRALRPDATRQWGTMTAPQAMAHCATGLEIALGEQVAPRLLLGRLLGAVIKPLVLRDDAPMRRNSPTIPVMLVRDTRELEPEQERLAALVTRFAEAGPAGCTTQPHSFFGRLRPNEWAILMYKHLDHHLRQFGA